MIIKNIGHWWAKKDITILMPKNGISAPKGDNLELFQWYMHFKSCLGPKRIDFLEWFLYHMIKKKLIKLKIKLVMKKKY